jgi:uncharacterized membrane-anchored protein
MAAETRQVHSLHVALPRGAKEELVELARNLYVTPTAYARLVLMKENEKARREKNTAA